jgi:hypothetical protein
VGYATIYEFEPRPHISIQKVSAAKYEGGIFDQAEGMYAKAYLNEG